MPQNPYPVVDAGVRAVALAAVAGGGLGPIIPLGFARSQISLQVTYTDPACTQVTVQLLGSIDGINFVTAITTYQGGTNGSNANGDIVSAFGIPVTFVRANLNALVGGTAPTVSAYIAAK